MRPSAVHQVSNEGEMDRRQGFIHFQKNALGWEAYDRIQKRERHFQILECIATFICTVVIAFIVWILIAPNERFLSLFR